MNIKQINTNKRTHFWLLIIVLAVATLAQINADMYTPSFMSIAKSLSVSVNHVQMSLSLYLFFMGLSQLFYGPISEGIGRKPTLIIGVLINAIGAFICNRAQGMEALLIGRIIQGIGVGSTASLFRAVLRDCFSGDELSKVISYIANGMIAITVAAPFLGSYFQQYLGWRSTFMFLVLYSLGLVALIVLRFSETNVSNEKSKLNPLFVVSSYKEVLSSRIFIGYTLCVLFTYGGLFSWITAASPLLIKLIGLSPVTFGYLMLLTAISTALGSNLNGLWVKKLGSRKLLLIGWTIMVTAGLLMLLLSYLFIINVSVIIFPALLFILGSAFIWGNTFALAFKPFAHIAGYAASVYGCLQVIGGAIFAFILSHIAETSQLPLSLMLISSGVLALLSYFFIARTATQ